jgi:hypothetical protein
MVAPQPIRIVVSDDLSRSRLTVFFRLILAIPHFIWIGLWSIAAFFAAVASWFATLASGQSPAGLHRFLAAFVRYVTHVLAYVYLAADPFPAFTGEPRTYPVDLEIDPPQPQARWKTLLRIILFIPAAALSGVLVGWYSSGSSDHGGSFRAGSAASIAAVLLWFYVLVKGRATRGLRNFVVYAIGYFAQTAAYVLLLTDRYPYAGPEALNLGGGAEEHPIRMQLGDDLRRSRLTVFFRLLLAVPHIVWLLLWSVAAWFAAIANWFVAVVNGEPSPGLHRFLGGYIRYATYVNAYFFLVTNPFPAFTGAPGANPVELELPPPSRQSRWAIGFRIFLALPALLVAEAIRVAMAIGAVLTWFASLATGRAPLGLRNLGSYALRYQAQGLGYLLLLTDRYPDASP